ncbi:MAG: terminase family protein [Pseudomonadota bacterium]
MAWLASLSEAEIRFLERDWRFWARDDQLPPDDASWTTWLLLGGRGAGKTRAGAEWVRAEAAAAPGGRIALVGETYHAVREVMIEGASGLLAVAAAGERPKFEASRRRLVWPNGAVAQAFSAEEPDGLRGPQFALAWSDELCKWRYAEETWSNLQMALRLGDRPRQTVTTTPRPTKLLKRLLAQETTRVARAATQANRANLAPTFLSQIVSQYAGTRLGRQELDGELLDDAPGALWRWTDIEAARISKPPLLDRIVVAIDPPATAGPDADECGLVVAGAVGRGPKRTAYVLADLSLRGARPTDWAGRAVAAYRSHEADCIVAEVNQGGDMVRSVIGQVDPSAPVRDVRATRGKIVRAEPIAALYEQKRVRHVGAFAALEDQMAAFGADGARGSPDRVDALVWALTDLMLTEALPEPGLRRV